MQTVVISTPSNNNANPLSFISLNSIANMKKSPKKSENKKTEALKKRYAENPEFRKKMQTQNRERYQQDPEYRKKTLERAKNRYHNDPEYRKATIERSKERYRKNKARRNAK